MVGTAQGERTVADTDKKFKGTKKNKYKTVLWQHDSESLSYKMWSDNNLVLNLSNFHTPKVVNDGLKRKRKVNGVRKRDPADIPCP